MCYYNIIKIFYIVIQLLKNIKIEIDSYIIYKKSNNITNKIKLVNYYSFFCIDC